MPATNNELGSAVLHQPGKPAECYLKYSSHGTDEEALTAELREAIQGATDQLPQEPSPLRTIQSCLPSTMRKPSTGPRYM